MNPEPSTVLGSVFPLLHYSSTPGSLFRCQYAAVFGHQLDRHFIGAPEEHVPYAADDVDDEAAVKVARDIANKVENEMTYPGEIQITLLREVRCIEYAK